ncbi:MAG: hydrogenase formation protein HypD [Coriobacteriales bacterium]|jgi:hydrogenase expression/formation protein HypD|nr:hydrogenase formation protein HypD [Coriobacteriales bacterium]
MEKTGIPAAAAATTPGAGADVAAAANAATSAPTPPPLAPDTTRALIERFRDPALARELIATIQALAARIDRPVNLMEVCGTHTVAIAKSGFRSILPANIRLISGPGCPVCVTANVDIDRIIALARVPGVVVATFGDMIRVPGSSSSLQQCAALGAQVEVVYSPLDALRLAQENPQQQIVFVGVGFETTTPLIASTIERAAALGLANFSVIGAHKRVPPALDALVNDPQVALDALILPGHVSTILGSEPYEFLSTEHHIPGVITGFDPVDVLQGIAGLLQQLAAGTAGIQIAYARAVMTQGNPTARAAIDRVFAVCDATWRGLGLIPSSGYTIRDAFASYDATRRFTLAVEKTVEPKGCRCGDVLRGVLSPNRCPLFGKACTPQNPIGPCMVSSEGSCAAYFRYQVKD